MKFAAVLLLAVLLAGCALPAGLVGEEKAAPLRCADFVAVRDLPSASPPVAATPALPTLPPTIERDDFGVPIIRAETTAGIWGAIGYAMADDRLWQMEHKRLTQQGRLTEVYGEARAPADVAARLMRATPETLAGLHAELEPDTRATLDAYVAGINIRVEEAIRDPLRRPAEFVAYGWTPTPWTSLDVVEVMLQEAVLGVEGLSLSVFHALDDKFDDAEALAAFGDIVPAGSAQMPTSIPASLVRYEPRAHPDAWDTAQLDALRSSRALFETPAGARLLSEGYVEPRGGSNAIVVAPSRSATGGALLLGGPQVGYETPAVYWEARVESQGETWNVFIKPGEALPRGRIGSAAFVITTGYADQHDLVLLELDPADPERYRYGSESLAFTRRDDVLVEADRAGLHGLIAQPTLPRQAPALRPETLRWSHLGPVVVYDAQVGWAAAQQSYTPRGQLGYLDVLLDETLPGAAGDAAAMRARLAGLVGRVDESTNVLAAFEDGAIALWHLGNVPERPVAAGDRRLPRLGEPATESTRLWAPSCLPRAVNPEQGYLLNWNNAPAAGWPHMAPRPWMWGASHRVQPLSAALADALEAGPLDLDALDGVNQAVAWRDEYAHAVVPRLVELAARDARLASIADWVAQGSPMRDDDGDGRADHAGLAAYEAWRAALQAEVFGELGDANKLPAWGEDLAGRNYDDHGISFWTEGPLLALLDGRAGHDWWDDVRTREREGPGEILARTLGAVPAGGGTLPTIHFRRTGLGPDLAMPLVNRGSINYLVDFAGGETRTILPPGQSGDITLAPAAASVHVADQLAPFERFAYKVYG